MSNHRVFKLCTSNLFVEIIPKNDVEFSIDHSDIAETESKVNVFVVFDQILDSQEKCIKCIIDNIDSKACGSSNWDWVGINSSESFLINRVLTDRRGNFFLSWVSDKVVLNERINDKNRFEVMNIFSILSLSENINLRANIPLSDFRKLSLHIVSEGSEFLHIH